MENTYIRDPLYWIFQIHGPDGSMLVGLHPDGSLEYGPGYDPDDAAKVFWQAMTRHSPIQPLSLIPYQDPDQYFWEINRVS